MALTSLTARSYFIASAFAAAALCVSAPAFAAAPSITPKVLQCDGSYLTGSLTSHPLPTILVDLQDTNPGLKVGQRRLSLNPANTIALWRFDGDYGVTVSSGYATGCPNGCCKSYYYNYVSTNGSANVATGQCNYTDAVNNNCSVLASMTAFGGAANNQPPVQIGACPADPSTLAVASSSFAITQAGPLAGLTTVGGSSTALSLNGSQWATAPNSNNWGLPSSYTLSAWIKTAGAGRIVSQQGATGYWGIGVNAAGNLRHFDSREAAGQTDIPGGTGLTNNAWHLVHLVRRNAIDRRFYIDGVLVSTAVASSTTTFFTHQNNATLEIGRYNSGGAGSEYLTGQIDDVRLQNGTITDDDIMLEWTTTMHKYSSDSGVHFSTAGGTFLGGPNSGTTAVVTFSTAASGILEPYSATARWEFVGQSIDGESAFGASYGVAIDNSPPIAPTLLASVSLPGSITWSWGAPPRVCLPPGSAAVTYNLVDAVAGTNLLPPGAMPYTGASMNVGETIAGSPNQLVGRQLRLTDTWGSGLSGATSIYTLANPPLALSVVPTAVSTGSALISWNQNGNPSYTRYLLSISQDGTFATGVSTPTTLASNFTGSSVPLSGLLMGTTYFARVQAFSGRSTDSFGGAATVFVSTSFTTLPATPGLNGVPTSTTYEITWSWTAVTGALYYKLFDVAGSTLYAGGNLSFTQVALSTNTQYSVQVEAVSGNGPSARNTATTFTRASDPTTPVVSPVQASSITYSWNANFNPAYTFYELQVTTDATYGIIVATLTVNATTATATGLFPGTTYYARVRSLNGSQIYGTGFAVFAATRTVVDPSITVVLAPPSAYVPPSGSVGQWQFDVGAGTVTVDSSGFNNTAYLTCLTAGCVSTPTFSAGPTGLGTAVAFSGVDNGLVRVPDAAQYAFNDDLTVSAWVNPSSLAQPNGAGIVVRGNGGAETFALDVSGGLYRFLATPAKIAVSTNALTMGTWTHLIGVHDSVAGTATLYVNGRTAPATVMTVAGVPLRSLVAHDISVGNRQSAAAGYNRGFLGAIDSVRVQHRAMSAAEALAEYQGSFVSTVTPPSPNNNILIGLAPNAFGAPANIFVSVNPFTHPISISPAVLNAGLTVIPTGFTLVPNSVIEIVPIVNGAPFAQTLGSSASISMPYADANNDNILDNSNPPLAASALRVYTLNTTVNRWEALPTYIDPASKRVTVFTPHFSVFAMFAPLTIGTSLSQVRVYPIPWKPGTNTRYDAAGITFDRLPVSGSVRILTLAGERVREFTFDGSASGSVVWNGLTDAGLRTASGVYFARITGDDGSTSLVKFAIER